MADDGRMVEDATTDVEWTKDELETLNEGTIHQSITVCTTLFQIPH